MPTFEERMQRIGEVARAQNKPIDIGIRHYPGEWTVGISGVRELQSSSFMDIIVCIEEHLGIKEEFAGITHGQTD